MNTSDNSRSSKILLITLAMAGMLTACATDRPTDSATEAKGDILGGAHNGNPLDILEKMSRASSKPVYRSEYFRQRELATAQWLAQAETLRLSSAEIAIVGNDGLIGIALFMGGESTPSRAVVQSAGYGYRLSARALKEEFARTGNLQLLVLRYTQALITQIAQTAVCNRHHSVDKQLCRWLLLSLDRLPSNKLKMTQELIANMLGVRRGGVTTAAHKLQKEGLIEYSRGTIVILDRQGLEKRVCECYMAVKSEADRLFPKQPRSKSG